MAPVVSTPQEALRGEDRTITAIVLTFNEEAHIERCLAGVKGLAERIIVVDSYSTDRTLELARAMGAEVFQRPFRHQADQFQWALDNCDIRSGWVLRLDADEYIEAPLIEEIKARLPGLPSDVCGVDFQRKFFFMGRWIKWGGYYPTILTRLWRTGVGHIEQRWMDEHVVLSCGSTVLFAEGDIVDENLHGIGAWVDKHNRYATRQMVDFIGREHGLFAIDERMGSGGNKQARWKRFLRNSVFAPTPLYVRSVLYFVYRYVFRLGVLDGRAGLVYHFMQGFWFFMLIDAKIDEARRYIAAHGLEAFREHLCRHHRIKL
jgi:glycosyltransferase involved in cell wall biosynthesis